VKRERREVADADPTAGHGPPVTSPGIPSSSSRAVVPTAPISLRIQPMIVPAVGAAEEVGDTLREVELPDRAADRREQRADHQDHERHAPHRRGGRDATQPQGHQEHRCAHRSSPSR
jgi:hypothetical protein